MDEPEKNLEPDETAGQSDQNQEQQAEKYESLYQKHKENIYFRWGLTAVVVVVVCILASQLITQLPAIYTGAMSAAKTLSSVLYGLCIAYLLDPVVKLVRRILEPLLGKVMKTPGRARHVSRGIGILVALALLVAIVYALLAMIIPQLINSIGAIITGLPDYYNTISEWVLARVQDLSVADYTEEIMQKAYEYMMSFLSDSVLPKLQTFLTTLTTSVVGMIKGTLNLVIGIIVSVYLLSGKDRFLAQSRKLCYAVLGESKGGAFCNVCTYANRVFGSFIGGKIIDSAIIGILCFLGMTILKLPYALLISVIIGCTNIIPVFGPFLGAIPSAFLLLVVHPFSALVFVIFILVLQQIDGNIIGPLILGDATGLGSFWVVVAILIFGGIWGIFGMIIGVPLFAVFYKIVVELTNNSLKKRGLSTQTKDYWDGSYPERKNPEVWNPVSRRQKRKHRRQLRRELRALEKFNSLHLRRHEQQTDSQAQEPAREAAENHKDTES